MRRSAARSGIRMVIALAALLVVGSAPAAPTATVVMSGLDNPRGLAWGPGHVLYVAEAGKGGTGQCMVLRGENQCVGATGAISRLDHHGVQQRVVTGLPSYAPQPSGAGATGAHDVGFKGGKGYATIGLGADPAARAVLGNGFGHLVRFDKKGKWKLSTDISAYETSANPDGGVVESNPYGLLTGGGRLLVTDAGGNDLLSVGHHGSISTVAVFPSRPQRPTDSVPTAVTRGPDKAYYVSELTGAPFAPGAANIYRVVPGQAPQVYRSGFTDVLDLEFAHDGSLYVLEHATGPFLSGPGAVIRVAPDGTRTTVYDALTQPTSLLLARGKGDGKKKGDDKKGAAAIYVSNRGTSAAVGEVLRIQP
jgi:hypothetical protein